MGGQPKSNACGNMSRAVRRSAQEPTEAIPQNQRDAVGILFTLGRGGCQWNNHHHLPACKFIGDDNGKGNGQRRTGSIAYTTVRS
jgi:hypothetical protein